MSLAPYRSASASGRHLSGTAQGRATLGRRRVVPPHWHLAPADLSAPSRRHCGRAARGTVLPRFLPATARHGSPTPAAVTENMPGRVIRLLRELTHVLYTQRC